MNSIRFRLASVSVRGRILVGFVLITLVVLITVVAGYSQLVQVRAASTQIPPNSLQIARLQEFALSVASFESNLDRYFVIGGSDYRENVQTNLEELVSIANILQESDTEQTREATSNLVTEATTLQTESLTVLDANLLGLSSAEINLKIIGLYDHVDQIKSLQQELTDQTLALLQDTAETQQSIILQVLRQFSILGVAALLISGVAMFFITRILAPISVLTEVAQDISSGNLERVAPVQSADEIGTLARSFNSMTEQLRNLISSLEQRVESRTRALQASIEVGRQLATILNLDQLLSEVVNQIQSTFNYYHAHIYLLNEEKQKLEMAGGTGEAGIAMLAARHSLRLDQGLVGRAATTKNAVLIPDVSQDPNWLPNSLLPETKAETAVPIIYGGTLIGILDVQHDVINGLSEEDVRLLESIASQVAIAIRNARLYAETQRQAQQEALLNEINQKILSTTNMQQAMQVTVRELGRATNATQVKVKFNAPKIGNGSHETDSN